MPQKFRYVIDGIGYPSVTEILGTIEKPGLKKWKESTPDSEFISRDRATIGTIVHWRIGRLLALKHSLPLQAFHVDDLSVINHKCNTPNCYNCARRDKINLSVNTIMSYYDDFTQAHTLEPIHLEKTVCNPEYGYAGTLDFIGYVDNKPCILDFKTAKIIMNDNTYGAQLSAYRKTAIEYHDHRLFILRMNDETGYELREMIDDWEMFLTALNAFKEKFPERQAQKI